MKRTGRRNFSGSIRKGFTLVELMVVLVILGLLAGLVSQKVIQYISKAKIQTARTQIAIFKNATKNYKIDTGEYPDESMGLLALVEEPPDVIGWNAEGYLESYELPLDPWYNEYMYNYPGEYGEFDIYSFGADGKEGGEEGTEDADIYDSDVMGRIEE